MVLFKDWHQSWYIYPQTMITANIRIDSMPGKQQAIIEVLVSVQTMTRLKPGCISSMIYEEYGNGQEILYMERWQTKEDLQRHIQSNLYLRVLNAIELANQSPEIIFYDSSETKGIELIEAIRMKGVEGL
jgi:quinol monooxygenase YgiN